MRVMATMILWGWDININFGKPIKKLGINPANNFDSLQICSKTEDQDDDGDDRDVDEYDIDDEVEESDDDTGIQGWW